MNYLCFPYSYLLDPSDLIVETTTALLPLLALPLLIIVVLFASARSIPQDQALVVFRLGRFVAVQHTGRRVLIPLIDQGVWVYLGPQSATIPNVSLLLNEREPATLKLDFTFRVVDPAASVIQVANVRIAMSKLLQTTLQTLAANQTRDEVWSQRRHFEKELVSRTRTPFTTWGIELQQVKLRDLE